MMGTDNFQVVKASLVRLISMQSYQIVVWLYSILGNDKMVAVNSVILLHVF